MLPMFKEHNDPLEPDVEDVTEGKIRFHFAANKIYFVSLRARASVLDSEVMLDFAQSWL